LLNGADACVSYASGEGRLADLKAGGKS
jgi:hypothetical protein